MKNLRYIFLILLVFAIPDFAAVGSPASATQKPAEINHADTHFNSAIYPKSSAAFYGFQIPVEKRVQSPNRLSESKLFGDDEDGDLYHTASISANRRAYSEFLYQSQLIAHSQTVKQLIFPFHSFL